MNKKNHFKTLIAGALFLISMSAAPSLKAQQWGHYTLYSVMGNATARLIDTNSVVYHTWTLSATYKTGYSAYMLPGGTLLKTVQHAGNSFSGGPICGEVVKVDWSGNITWDFVYSTTDYCSHHDICPMPNGNVLLISYERKTAAEVTAAGCTFSGEMWPDKIVEVQPTGSTTGTVVWEWKAWDHLVQNINSSAANYQTSIVNHPELLNINYTPQKDWMHMNGVDYNPILDQVTFSCHNLSEMYIIDHSTTTAEAATHSGGNSGKGGDLLYRWGHPAVYNASGSQVLNVVHDAHWVKEGLPNPGYLVGFNNNGISSAQSSVDQVSTPVNEYNYNITLGQAFTPATYTLRHACNGHAMDMGNSQQLPNGNMLVCVSTAGSIYEIDPSGTSIWSFSTGGNNAKAFRYDDCYVSNAAPAIPVITETSGTLSSSAATTYQWYMNGQLMAGETSQSYTPAQTGIYLVRITDANSCVYQYSAGYHFILSSGIKNIQAKNNFSVYPNPSSGLISVDKNYFGGNDFEVTVYDCYGKIVAQRKNCSSIDLSGNSNGIYNVAIRSELTGLFNNKIILIK